ncbi:2-C-methyl-D-erythritol 2,4-cyclodiphosphate synthase [uncultured Candidatus Pelagibacter sp.]|jgi:2-C-methyl-D-erythritol 4-phosphate cytidylyltransferase/2-C-methyl-D-erythritol 2,4-cyclodiphosphate synthase|uniref:2-C-methyl-D-erythritol 2,4-cyclodiphosphate synthase n=1 Tax=uncultured Candidatus Pelagibacter sp. TaxID=372654 RepID=UPI002607F87B|nr:2-C-methyl-D-erythritol 2,4-cyclodiphosphate synthase [uncultured Candidatus Pelagibacter sp.]
MMNNYFIILASGQSKRFNSNQLKQFITYKNKALFEHSLDKAMNSKLFKKIILVVNEKKQIKKKYSKDVVIIKGGKERSDSSLIALKYIKKFKPSNVLIHDAARPNFTIKLLKRLIKSLQTNKASIPVISSKDSIKYKVKNQLFNLDKKNSYLTQTPQAFKFKDIYNLSIKQKKIIQDEATLFINNNFKIKFINGEILNDKITFKEDINNIKTFFGIGFDIHRLVKDKKLYLGGIKIPFHSGLKGHSDGDVILHSVIDSLLGAMRKKDIGTFFPDNRNKFKNIRSPKMLKPIVDILNRSNFYINNLDINLICEQPKVSKYRNKIINSLSDLLNLDKDLINLKGKTVEKLGLIGKEKAIACEVICSISQ